MAKIARMIGMIGVIVLDRIWGIYGIALMIAMAGLVAVG
jgi:hypothetical protein